jgi:phosphatidylglycerol---prolipoprotein diacylglyceryl transferase
MYPRLDLGSVSVTNYTALLVLGVIVGGVTAWRLAAEARLGALRSFLLIAGCVFAGLMGAHLLYVCTQWEYYRAHPARILAFWDGRAFIGGPVFTLLFVIAYTRAFGMSIWKVGDCLMPGLTIGHFFGRLGCCAAGCCHGGPTDSIFGVSFFTRAVKPALRGVPLHPTQLYEAAGLLVLFYGLLWLWRRRSFDGQVGLAYYLAYPVLRFGVECFRGDDVRGFVVGWLSTSQLVSLLMFAGAATALILRYRRAQRNVADAAVILSLPAGASGPNPTTTVQRAA